MFIFYMRENCMDSSSDPFKANSVREVKAEFVDWVGFNGEAMCDAYFIPDADASEAWEVAERFTGVGVPFDGISFRLTVGPRGGVVKENG